jgi:hypothetical protein
VAGLALQQVQGAGRGQARTGDQPPVHPRAAGLRQAVGQQHGQGFALGDDAHAGRRRVTGDQQSQGVAAGCAGHAVALAAGLGQARHAPAREQAPAPPAAG